MNILKAINNILPSTRRFVDRKFEEEKVLLLEVRNTISQYVAQNEVIIKKLDNICESDNNIDAVLLKIKTSVQELSQKTNADIASLGNKLEEQLVETQNQVINNNDVIKRVDWHILNKPVLWKNQFEKNIVFNNWGDVCQREDFAERFLRLVKGLDDTSIDCVERILQRQHSYLNNPADAQNLYTLAEQEELRKLEDEFKKRIFKIADDLYAYKGYLLPQNHFEASVFYYKLGINQISFPESLSKKTIIDVGAFIGDSVLVLNEIPHKDIIAFEADPQNYQALKKTVEMNKVGDVICENCALGAQNGNIRLHTLGPMSSMIDRKGVDFCEDIDVEQCTLDSYVKEHNICCGLIKVDIEGGEPSFLQGAKETIISQKPILLLSIYHNEHDFFELKPMLEEWNIGYQFKIYKPTDGNITSETLLIASVYR